ncbi:hypothetical protein [Streptomyces mobaraensis]|uniref:Uncharacterized protein n=1 Tax=Streptomyces mobaraensis TaxID=35621 RepID=A0A5N5VXP6_STRMB|nr:hypothetical protein [Streptomyces mobaraensis]KAB7833557.1 hypothetical protein FRZ00_33475 [Streptomyces mobaraensis]
MSIEWSTPDENGARTAWATREDGVRTQWTQDEHGWTSPTSADTSAPSPYEQQLTAAGYGDGQRQHYIEQSGQDPEYAACVWDEQIMLAAEAAGEIPARPVEPLTPAEQAENAARSQAMREYWQQYPEDQGGWDPLSNDNDDATKAQFDTFVSERTQQLLSTPEPSPAEYDDDFDMDL